MRQNVGSFMSIARSAVFALVFVVSSGSVAAAKDFDEALAAYNAGDYASALNELLPLARHGNALAQYNVGMTYDEGYGDYVEAAKWYLLAAEQGDVLAQTNLGHMYDHGDGVPQDDTEAVKWYLLAAEQGNVTAQFNLGVMFRNGDGVVQDHAEALRWYKLAAEQGDAYAQSTIGMMHDNGEGVPQDNVKAYMWYLIGAVNGLPGGDILVASVAEEMTPSDVSEAERRARVCMVSNYQDCERLHRAGNLRGSPQETDL